MIPNKQTLRTIFSCCAAISLSGCADFQTGGVKPIGKIGRIGLSDCPTETGLLVRDVRKDSAAETAGIQTGDEIVGVNGLDLAKPENRKEFLFPIRSGKQTTLSIKRQGQTIEVKALPKVTDMYPLDPVLFALMDDIDTGKKVSVAFVVTEVNFAGAAPNYDGMAGWKAGIKSGMETTFEGMLLNNVAHCGNYGVVDRNKTNEILGELHFQMTGAVDSNMMKTVGKMTGATHLLFASMTRFGDPYRGWKDETDFRLVDLESGNLLATASLNSDVPK